MERVCPARISGTGRRDRRLRGASRGRLRFLQRSARAGALHLGRGQDHRFRAPLGSRLQQRARRLADRTFRRRMGGRSHRSWSGASRLRHRLRHRFGPRPAHHRWRQDVEPGLLRPYAGWQLDHRGDRRHHLLRRPLRPLRRAPHVHQLHRHRLVGQRYVGRQLVQHHALRRAASVGEHHLLDGVRPQRARPYVGRDERHARPAASQDVAPRIAGVLHRRRGAQRRRRTHVARAE